MTTHQTSDQTARQPKPAPHPPHAASREAARRRIGFKLTQVGAGMSRYTSRSYRYETECVKNHGRIDALFEATVKLRNSGIVIARHMATSKIEAAEWCLDQALAREAGK